MLQTAAALPGLVLPLLPSFTCPACLAAYAGFFSAIGLSALLNERLLAPLIVSFLALGVASIAWTTRSHRQWGPLVGGVLGALAVVLGRVLFDVPLLLYGGLGVLTIASLWNVWLKRPARAVSG